MFSAQLYKQCQGYYFNHDYLLALNPPQRQRALTYFIATQTPEKLEPLDRNKFQSDMNNSLLASDVKGIVFGAVSSVLLFRRLRIQLITMPLMIFAFQQFCHNIAERKLIQGEEIKRLCLKYNFTLFDFQDSKRSTQIQKLVDRLSFGVNSPLNSNLY